VVNARSFNETLYGGVPDPDALSERVLDWVREDVLPQCTP